MKKFIAKILMLTTLCSIVPIPAFVQAQSSSNGIYENLGVSKEELDHLIKEHGFYEATQLIQLSFFGSIVNLIKNKGLKVWLTISALSFVLTNSAKILSFFNSCITACKNTCFQLYHRLTHSGLNVKNYELIIKRIEKRLRAELIGQDEAIDKIISILKGYFEERREAEYLNKKFESGLFLYFSGSPATGKSTAMKIIEEELNLGSYPILMSNIVDSCQKDTTSLAALLTRPKEEDDGKNKTLIDTPLMRQLKSGLPTIYCFDEIEKMRLFEANLQHKSLINEDGKIYGSSIDEILRNFVDTGLICNKNSSGSIVIATSNETDEQFNKLEDSLKNRLESHRVKFKDFNQDDYKELIKRKSSNFVDYYKKKYNCNVSWSPEALEHYSEEFESTKIGGRGVNSLITKASYTLKEFSEKNRIRSKSNLLIDFDYDTQNIVIRFN